MLKQNRNSKVFLCEPESGGNREERPFNPCPVSDRIRGCWQRAQATGSSAVAENADVHDM